MKVFFYVFDNRDMHKVIIVEFRELRICYLNLETRSIFISVEKHVGLVITRIALLTIDLLLLTEIWLCHGHGRSLVSRDLIRRRVNG